MHISVCTVHTGVLAKLHYDSNTSSVVVSVVNSHGRWLASACHVLCCCSSTHPCHVSATLTSHSPHTDHPPTSYPPYPTHFNSDSLNRSPIPTPHPATSHRLTIPSSYPLHPSLSPPTLSPPNLSPSLPPPTISAHGPKPTLHPQVPSKLSSIRIDLTPRPVHSMDELFALVLSWSVDLFLCPQQGVCVCVCVCARALAELQGSKVI